MRSDLDKRIKGPQPCEGPRNWGLLIPCSLILTPSTKGLLCCFSLGSQDSQATGSASRPGNWPGMLQMAQGGHIPGNATAKPALGPVASGHSEDGSALGPAASGRSEDGSALGPVASGCSEARSALGPAASGRSEAGSGRTLGEVTS